MKSIVFALTLLVPGAVFAQGGPVERARARDAAIDHGLIASHAETIGAGKWSFNSYELFAVGLTYGFTDDFQLSVSTLLPIVSEMPLVLSVAPKLVLWRGHSTTLAAQVQSFIISVDGETAGLGSAGLAVDQYLDGDGRLILHGGLQAGKFFGTTDSGINLSEGALAQLDVGITAGLTDLIKVLLEAKIFAGFDGEEFKVANVVLVNYGVRFHGQTLAADLGFLKPVGEDSNDDFVLGLPFVSFSARF
jgi:hypothetical protein